MAYFFMFPSRLQARLLQDAVEGARRKVIARLPGNGHSAGLPRVLELSVTAAGGHSIPSHPPSTASGHPAPSCEGAYRATRAKRRRKLDARVITERGTACILPWSAMRQRDPRRSCMSALLCRRKPACCHGVMASQWPNPRQGAHLQREEGTMSILPD